jgi:hypothetical protein
MLRNPKCRVTGMEWLVPLCQGGSLTI